MKRRPIPASAYAMQELYAHEPRALKPEHSSYSWFRGIDESGIRTTPIGHNPNLLRSDRLVLSTVIRCADPQHAKV